MSSKSVIVIGGGLAGLSSAVALAEAGLHVRLLEQRPFLGGRASSYLLPGGEEVDNCQHVTLGCCTNLADFYRRVGAAGKVAFHERMVFVDAEGRHSTLQSSPLPAPLHLAPSLLLYGSLTLAERLAVGKAMLAIAERGGRNSGGDAEGVSMRDWLLRHGQSESAMRRFWSVVLVSALNEDLERIDARYGLDVFWKAFIANREGYKVGLPSAPLGDLYGGCRTAIENRGGEVLLRAAVRNIRFDEDLVAAIETGAPREETREQTADYYLFAVPHEALLELLPTELIAREAAFHNLLELKTSPITGVHLWFDRDVMSEPFLAIVDRTTQWIFNKSRLYGGPGDGRYLQLVISASRDLVPMPRQAIIDLCLAETRAVLPDARGAALLKAVVIKETAATFSPQPGVDRFRPRQKTSLPNLFLAGDWTATGWPATMEGAVRSGYLAAEAILAAAGDGRSLLRPELPVEGLSRRFL